MATYSYTTIDYPSAVNGTYSYGISNSGQIIGTYEDSSLIDHGFVYSGGSFTIIDPFATKGTYPLDINEAGQIAGWYVDNSNISHGFVNSGGGSTTIDDPLGANGTYFQS